MKLKLKKLTLENFKGLKSFEIEPDGQTINIYGANNSGKTTLADAYHWLLFNKDSLNSADFGIKTLENGEPISMLNHMVTGIFDIDGKEVKLKKMYKEVWKKKRGHTNEALTGHETNYEINEVPKMKKEFDEYISGFIKDVELFMVLSDPMYFNSLDTKVKRNILMDVAGNVDDVKVIKSNKELQGLEKLLKDYTIEELKAKNKRDKTAVNEELKSNPIRIDEINKGLEEVPFKKDYVIAEVSKKENEVEAKNDEIQALGNGSKIIDLNNALKERAYEVRAEIDRQVSTAQHDLDQYIKNFDEGTNEQLRKLEYKHEADKSDLSIIASNEKRAADQLKEQHEYTDKLRTEYGEVFNELETVKNERKEFKVTTICDCCGQELPAEKVESHRNEQQEKYNEERAERIKDLTDKLAKTKENGVSAAEVAKEVDAQHEKTKEEVERVKSIITKNEEKIAELKKGVVKPEETDQYKEHSKALDELLETQSQLQDEAGLVKYDEKYKEINTELLSIENKNDELVKALETELKAIEEELSELRTIQSTIAAQEKGLARIKELKDEQSKLAVEYEKLEALEDKLNNFTVSKVEFIEESISKKFKYARFNLFETQLNGGLKEICVATRNGVPYDKGLNTEGRVNIGLDIINTLSEHYDLYTPILMDNGESVSKPDETEAQQIRFIVSENDEDLRMETV